MDFDSPDVEKDFPGLYTEDKTKKTKEDSDYSEGDHDKSSKKDLLIGRRKEKKDKKDRGYAALEGESSPEEELDAKSPSKSKKSKAFKFASSKSKEKREKSREKEKSDKDVRDEDKPKEKERPEKDKKKDKERKEKDKKDKGKEREKEKKDKKNKQPSVSEDVLELGDVQPVFGVSVSLATERSRCHDGIDLPLVVRDCIDYLQENALKNEQIYRVEPVKTRLHQFKRLYNNRERQESDELDVPTACGLLKLFLRELPEPILTTDLIARFEEVASHPQVTQQEQELSQLCEQLPNCNKTLLSWILLHFDEILKHEKFNKMNAQSLAMLLSPPLQMSHRLLVALFCHCSSLFGDVNLSKYIPPITSSSPKIPDQPNEIQTELRKQESLLAQIHSEMNAGFVSKKREEQLWEVQRIITQLKRKLRSFEKKQEKSVDDAQACATHSVEKHDTQKDAIAKNLISHSKLICSDDESSKTVVMPSLTEPTVLETKNSSQDIPDFPSRISEEKVNEVIPPDTVTDKNIPNNVEGLYIDDEIGFLMLPENHPEYRTLIRLQLENQELLAWKAQLQARISSERAEILRIKQIHQQNLLTNANCTSDTTLAADENFVDGDYEKIIDNYIRENALLEQKKNILVEEIFEENREFISMQVELSLKQFGA